MGEAKALASVRHNRRGPAPPTPQRGWPDLVDLGLAEACHYADKAEMRPSCRHLAVVIYSDPPLRFALCEDCDRRRSALGKGARPRRLPTPASLVALIEARDALVAAEEALDATVETARQAGQPWSAIASVLGMTKQAAHQRFRSPAGP
ncbi:MAG: hypothetical protein M0Z95_02150 [Actinomycetota bacterium]|nr:hypothetical protein [Actinomycetota bacterium]